MAQDQWLACRYCRVTMKCQILNSNERYLVLPMDMEIINFHVRRKIQRAQSPYSFMLQQNTVYVKYNTMLFIPVSSLKMLTASLPTALQIHVDSGLQFSRLTSHLFKAQDQLFSQTSLSSWQHISTSINISQTVWVAESSVLNNYHVHTNSLRGLQSQQRLLPPVNPTFPWLSTFLCFCANSGHHLLRHPV